ncbi:MAG TPA: hypothetical protein VGK74_02905 [Symbiobacteriaceae bacterium]|jgi:hypothetical protein
MYAAHTGNRGLAVTVLHVAGPDSLAVPIWYDPALAEDRWLLVTDGKRGKPRTITETVASDIRRSAPADGWDRAEPVRDVHRNILLVGDRVSLLGCFGLTATITGFVTQAPGVMITTEGRTPVLPVCVLRVIKEANVA